MSGPLASWVAEHSTATYRGRAVLLQYALAANHDGTPAADVTRDDLKHRTGLGQMTVVRGRQEVIERKELEELEAPGGRHRVGKYRVVVALCPDGVKCWSCDVLAKALKRRRPSAKTVHPRDGLEGGARSRNRPPQSTNRPPGGPTTQQPPVTVGISPPVQRRSADDDDQPRDSAVASGGMSRTATLLPQLGIRDITMPTHPPPELPGGTAPPLPYARASDARPVAARASPFAPSHSSDPTNQPRMKE